MADIVTLATDTETRDEKEFFDRLERLQTVLDGMPVGDALDLLAWATAGIVNFIAEDSGDRHYGSRLMAEIGRFASEVTRLALDIEATAEEPRGRLQ